MPSSVRDRQVDILEKVVLAKCEVEILTSL
jgi:hypothetical protein